MWVRSLCASAVPATAPLLTPAHRARQLGRLLLALTPAAPRAAPQLPRLQVEWAHIDMAGPVWRDKDGGATGFGAQMLAEWAVAQGR